MTYMQELIDDKNFQANLRLISNNTNVEFEEVLKEATTYIEELYTDQHPVIQTFGVKMAQYILERGYEKSIDVNEEEIKALSKLMRRHSVAFVMTHKTYIDMFVLGVILAQYGLPIPFIFGGINMSFLGIKELGKRSGTIFIRRSFKENLIYKACLRHFIKSIIDKGQHFMWAIEGTRSRTGKLVWPKMGILKYIMESEQVSKNDVKYVPVSIVYDLIPDVDEMMKEGRGKQKSQESLMWFLNYIRKMDNKMGKISIRFGEPTEIENSDNAVIPVKQKNYDKPQISKFAFELLHHINKITPVTTASLICTSLLSKFALTKKEVEQNVIELMEMIESHKPDALVSRGKSVSQSIQSSLNLLSKSRIVQQIGSGLTAKYSIVPENYLTATYYSNMAVHHSYHRAFVELALARVNEGESTNRLLTFWEEIMALRDLFKFEFFYSNKASFSDEVEAELEFINPEWETILLNPKNNVFELLKDQKIIMSQVVLSTYLEAYKVVATALKTLDPKREYEVKNLITTSLFVGEEMHWNGDIHRVESVSKPFLTNGIRWAQNKNLIPESANRKTKELKSWAAELEKMSQQIKKVQEYLTEKPITKAIIPITRNIVPGTKTLALTDQILSGEKGSHIGAFFDLDKTLISGFSAKEFFAERLTSGKMTPKEVIAQLSGILVYAKGKKDFAGLAAISAKGIKGIKEEAFIKVGEDVYMKHLSSSIYPESRALVDAHISMGHTVSIVSAATPYQVRPISRDLGIEHIMCTEMELEDGKFTGKIIDPPCWGEGKAIAGITLAERHNLDLKKSHFYTDSYEDLPLLEIVGHPHPINPDAELSKLAFENNWPVHRFEEIERPSILNIIRTGLTFGSILPAAFSGLATGSLHLSKRDGVNTMISLIGDLGTQLAGINLVVKGKENLAHRPAVFIFNHQSNADFLVMAKLIRKDAVAIAKKELKYTPIGPFFSAAGIIFIDRKDKDKAIEAMKPAVETLHNGISVAIAPEGTRSYDYNLGQFKKGAFHLAMQAGVPIIPIVIKNAHDIMPRGTSFVRPAIVEVVVQKPVSTAGWTKNNLNKKIKMVRDGYLKELNQGDIEVKIK